MTLTLALALTGLCLPSSLKFVSVPARMTSEKAVEPSQAPASAPAIFTLLTLAWPIVLARATQAVVGFSDALMVAPLGEDVLAAVTTGAMNVYAFVMFPMGTAFILQSFAAQLRGAGELQAVRRYAYYGLFLALLAGLVAALALPFLGPGIGLLGYEAAVAQNMHTYLEVRLLSVAGIIGVEALGNWYGGLGNTRVAMIAGVVTMVTNIIGNYLLIEPRFGLPGYGAAGAAWASAIASWIGFFGVLLLFLRKWGFEAPSAMSRLRWREFVRVLRFGLPNGVNWFLEFAAFAFFINVVVGHLGTTVLAGFNVVMQLNSISFMPAFGMSSAGAILVGEAIGQRALDRVGPIVRLTVLTNCAWMLTVGLIYFVIPGFLIGLFQPRNVAATELIAAGTTMLRMCGLWQLSDAVAMSIGEALRAAGDTAWPMFARIALAWFLFTPLAWAAVFVFDGGVVTVMLSLVVYVGVLSGLLTWRYFSGRWRTIQLLDAPHEPSLVD